MRGYVEWVEAISERAFTAEVSAAGATTLTLSDASSLGAAEQVAIAGVTYAVDSLVTGVDEDDPDTLVLSTPLLADLEAGEPVEASPTVEQTWAGVTLAGEIDVVTVRIDQDLQATLALSLGPRDEDAREVVEVEDSDQGLRIIGVEGRAVVNGDLIDPDTMPPAEPVPPVAPSESPVVEAVGGPGCVALSWSAVPNETPVTYDLHDVTSTAGTVTESTLVHSTMSTGFLVAPVDGTHLYVVWARSGDLLAPAPSEPVTATPSADARSVIVENAVYAKEGMFVGAGDGPGHDWDVTGYTLRGEGGVPRARFPTDVDESLFAKGAFEMETARAEKFAFSGRDNIISRGARVVMTAKIAAPDRLQLAPVWPEIRFSDDVLAEFGLPFFMNASTGSIIHAVCYDSTGDIRKFYALADGGSFDGYRPIDLTLDLSTNQITSVTMPGAGGSRLQDESGVDALTYCNGFLWTMTSADQKLRKFNPTTGALVATFNRPWQGNYQGIYAQGTTLKFWRHDNAQIGTWTINQNDGSLSAASTPFSHPASRGIPTRVQRGVYDEPSGNAQFVTLQNWQPQLKARAYYADGTYVGEWLQAPSKAYLWDLAWTNPNTSGVGEWISFGQYDVSRFGSRIGWRHDGDATVEGAYADRKYVGISGAWARDAAQTYHTTLSDTAFLYAPRTARLRVSWAPWPVLSDPPAASDVDRLFLYSYALGGSDALDEIAQVTDRGTQTTVVRTWSYTGPAEKVESDFADNTFPDSGQPGLLAASAGGFNVDGSSNGSWDLMKRPSIRRTRSTTQSVAAGSSTDVWLNVSGSVETDGSWTYASTSPFAMTCQVAGFYILVYTCGWSSAADGRRTLVLYLNGSQLPERTDLAPAGSYPPSQQVILADRFAAGDTVAARVLQTSSGSLDVTASTLTILKASA